MNWEQIKGIVERVATVAVTYAIGKGWIPAGQSADIVALIVLIGAIIWGWKVNTTPALVQATAALPAVNRVVVDDKLVAADLNKPDARVTSA